MKRQRNTQQVKEHEKCPPSQTKEDKRGNLPEKYFRIMIIKIIQNLESKMELQINRLETKIEKMQEMFNKDLEEIKKSQLKMNNAINEIKITMEGTMSRITETIFMSPRRVGHGGTCRGTNGRSFKRSGWIMQARGMWRFHGCV